MKLSPKKLSPKEKVFCVEYLKEFNATQAAICAGYSVRSARQTACRMLTKDYIRSHLDKEIESSLSNKRTELKAKILGRLELIADNNINNPDTIMAAIKSLELLGKYLTLFSERREIEVTQITIQDKAE
jgi:phage terminase small subunit